MAYVATLCRDDADGEGVRVPNWFFYLALAVFGLIFGSFANVVIWRVPRSESLSVPGSHCPKCGHPVRGYDNIPVVSWLVLRARCRDCGAPISWRYPAVEATSGVLWVSAGIAFGVTLLTPVAIFLFYMLLVLTFIDVDTMRIPNPLVAMLAVVGLLAAIASQVLHVEVAPLMGIAPDGAFSSPLVMALVGAVLGGGLVWTVAGLYQALRRRSGLGFGDVKLLAAMGLYLGPYVLLVVFLGSLLGAIYGIAAGLSKRELFTARIPFAPFLATAGVLVALFGPTLWSWYGHLVGIA